MWLKKVHFYGPSVHGINEKSIKDCRNNNKNNGSSVLQRYIRTQDGACENNETIIADNGVAKNVNWGERVRLPS